MHEIIQEITRHIEEKGTDLCRKLGDFPKKLKTVTDSRREAPWNLTQRV
jgi:hypothetical protein